MITRFYLKELLSFNEVELEFKDGLVVFSGPSGSGKSILMQAFLALFGYKEALSTISEATIDKATKAIESFEVDVDDELVIKEIKKEKVRYFLNAQNISKSNLSSYIDGNVRYIHLADKSDFKSSTLLNFVDKIATIKYKEHKKILDNYKIIYRDYLNSLEKLKVIEDEEKKVEELKEFAKFEISKIDEIDPKVGEYEELAIVKKQISKKEKIQEAINKASVVFNTNTDVVEALNLLEVDSGFYDDAVNELSNIFEGFKDKMYELEDINIEEVLTRIENLAHLQKKYGSIEEAIEYRQKKQDELKHYENLSFEKSELESKVKEYKDELVSLANNLSKNREKSAKLFSEKINEYLKSLYLDEASVNVYDKDLDINGANKIEISIKNVDLNKISSGELNRVRLALLASISEYSLEKNGILFLDEIDANVSGKESSAIANLLSTLSKYYQIFAISHQPQLSSIANQHFFIEKKNGESNVRELNKNERINEIARMISGETLTKEAKEFAKKLLS